MSKLRTLGSLALARTRCRKNGGLEKFSLVQMACMVGVFCAAAAIAAPGQTFTTLVNFDVTNGNSSARAALVQGTDGNFYGTTAGGGAYQAYGTIFKVTPEGALTTLHSFCAEANCPDGSTPWAGLIQATDGNLYGTTTQGGLGSGTIFKITPAGRLTTLYSLGASPNDGSFPTGTLLQATDGNFYGTTKNGGIYGHGTVFRMTPAGELTTLVSLCSYYRCFNASGPSPGLIQATNGLLYGTTNGGDGYAQAGTVFEMALDGAFSTLYDFTGAVDGYFPEAGLVQGSDGDLYGETDYGGTKSSGNVYKLTLGGSLSNIYSFCSQPKCADGHGPLGTMIQAIDGDLYGTTTSGGGNTGGTIFRLTTSGSLTTLYSFCAQANCTDGGDPEAGLLQSTNGKFYGTTTAGGTSNDGAIFSLDVGFAPFVLLQRTSGHVGVSVQILGQGFTGATAVSFNGIPASFTVKSDTYLTATVPSGAANGSVTVTEPSGTLTSNKIFRVTPWISSFSPTTGPAGTTVVITGTSFTGATVLSFTCGKKATFTVDSDTQITATVPEGALSGPINVVTPDGHWGSIPHFTVTP